MLLGAGNNTNDGAAAVTDDDDDDDESLSSTVASLDGDGGDEQGDGGLDMRFEVFNKSDGINVVLANISTTSSGHVLAENVTDNDHLFSNYIHFTLFFYVCIWNSFCTIV
jgi:hypothetical protein